MKNSNQLGLLAFLLIIVQIPLKGLADAENTTTVAFNVGVILELDEDIGKARLRCMSMALSDFYITHASYKTWLILHPRNSYKDNMGAASAALDLLKHMQVEAIIGPETSAQANFVADLGRRSHVPILSFSTRIPYSARNPYFFQTVQNDSSQVQPISAIFQLYGWTEAIVIYEGYDYENELISHLIDELNKNNIQISHNIGIPSAATDEEIGEALYKLMSMRSRVFVVHVTPLFGSRLFLKAKEMKMISKGYALIVTDNLINVLSSLSSFTIDSMQGVLGVRPYVPQSKELEIFTAKWKKEFLETTHLNLLQLWAYDTVWALAMAAEDIGNLDHGFLKPEDTFKSTDLSTLGESKIGPKFVDAISRTRFIGLSGIFHLIDRQLQSSVFQVVNVIGNQGREVGIWRPKNGIMRDFNATKKNTSSEDNLRVIIWPGESTEVPKSWSFSTNGTKLKIGVPMVHGIDDLVNAKIDPYTNETSITGYCIDLFNIVMKELPYNVSYEFIPFQMVYDTNSFQRSNISSNRSNAFDVHSYYDALLYQVYLQKFDAMVGDTTITANRSLYVDFTLPYSETGVSMIMSIKDNQKIDGWVFLKPFSKEMWATTAAAFIFTGCVIWVLEHRVNKTFRGSLSEQLGMIFWFSFSTVAFAQGERVRSNLTRFVMIIWIFVVLILTSSYTASLTSMLTVQQFDVDDVKQLARSGYIGYQEGSYVKRLVNGLGIDNSRLKPLRDEEEYDEALSKGSKRGGVSAILDEIPYLKMFLRKHCNKYSMVGPTYDSNGFGFAFPKGSPLLLDVSKAISELKDRQKLKSITSKWYSNVTECVDPGSTDSLGSLTLSRFRGLFLVTIATSTSAFLICFSLFLNDHMHILTSTRSEDATVLKNFVTLVKLFYKEDPLDASTPEELTQMSVTKPGRLTSTSYSTATSTNSLSTSMEMTITTQDETNCSTEELATVSPQLEATEMTQT